ncbi:MAG: Glyceraldehyde 3-phosphate dehydrogenase [Parcubacteria group bacterium GW2011_GWF2_38_76]|nr:MAG: Glyceraldehyde 3-phosphate dehydrogenase [Parcubacteria group bacterium GW2011_GWF2_38_76]HBM45675.1 type I glyceraldehyde-3-phosphate dehydrogenase [Patescibacteria group bacterium]
MKIAINGFGRIGRQFLKIALNDPTLEIVAINDLGELSNLAYLLEFDSVYRGYDKKVETKDGNLVVDGKIIKFLQEPEPMKLPWRDLGIDVVVECTGRFTSSDTAKVHLDAGAKRVVISAPAKDDATPTCTPNVNVSALTGSKITSNASCTSNSIIPIASILGAKPGIKYSLINTVHGYTAEQSLVDGPMPKLHKDFRRGRAAAQNIVPTTSGAASAVGKTIPSMVGKFDGMALRVPVPAGSILDFTFIAENKTSVEEINAILIEASGKPEWQGIFTVTDKPIVSSDILGSPYGSIVDLNLTKVVGGELVKVMAWYDNEWGYASMLVKHVLSLKDLLD